MSQIETVAVLTAREGSGDDLRDVVGRLAEATQAEEGCVFYSVQQGIEDPLTYVTVERWASREALEAHRATAHLRRAREELPAVLARPPLVVPTEVVDLTGHPKGRY